MTQVKSTFFWRARDGAGRIVTGSTIAGSVDEVGSKLRSDGKFVVSVSPADAAIEAEPARQDAPARGRARTAGGRVSRNDVVVFCQQMSVMLDSGVPLPEAMQSVSAGIQSAPFKRVIESVSDDIEGGELLSVALSRWPKVFPGVLVSLMRASEATGSMGPMFGQAAEYLSKEQRTMRQVRQALSYPVFMMVIGIGITVFLLSVVLPRFAQIYEKRSATLPGPTSLLIDLSNFITTQYMIYLPVMAVLVVASMVLCRTRIGRSTIDSARLNLPVIGRLHRQVYLSRFSRTMSTLVGAGVNLLDVITICRGVTPNIHFDRFWDALERSVKEGGELATAAGTSGLVPANVVSMIAAGERSGRLSEVLSKAADFSEDELEATVKHVTSIVEPVMICVMGVVVGSIAMALLLPIFSMGKVVTGG